jgi:hypothetical protein
MSNSRKNQIEFCKDIYWLLENSENRFDEKDEALLQTINFTHKNALWTMTRITCPLLDGLNYYGHSVVVKNMTEEEEKFSNVCFIKQHPNALPKQKDTKNRLNIDKYSFYEINVEKSLEEEGSYILK